MKKFIKKLIKRKKLSKIEIDVLRAISLYQKEHPGMGCQNDNDIINYYILRAKELNYFE
jgi:hypothetical protein